MGRRVLAVRIGIALTFVALAFLASGCEPFSSPQNTFAPTGDVADQQKNDFLLVMWPALVIGVGVMLGLVYIAFKYRRKKDDPGLPKQVHGNTPLELGWTIAPAILLAVIGVFTVAGIRHLAEDPGPEALNVHVSGQRFLWEFSYTDYVDDNGEPVFSNPTESGVPVLYIPVDRKIDLRITSIDVNHSFWVPKLAGKTDAINNHPNKMWIEANEIGTYSGQCAEFCGLDHSKMRFEVPVLSQEDFDAGIAGQGGTLSTPTPEGGDQTPTSNETPAAGEQASAGE